MNSLSKGLYIVSTPIGNLDDISLRAVKVLSNSDIILCEDTRHSLNLLRHLNIKKKLISYHKFNEKKVTSNIIEYLNEGKILSLISDAGTPTLSDPGNILINECIKHEINIFPIPGSSSITTAMSISGFESKFIFYGFLPKTENELNKVIKNLANLDFSLIFFAPSNKINFYIKCFKKHMSDRQIMIARELTKKYETIYRHNLKNIKLFKSKIKGELTIVISKKSNKDKKFDTNQIKNMAKKYMLKNTLKDVVKIISENHKLPKKLIYKICLELKNEKNI